MIIRLASIKDRNALLKIYSQYIDTSITFECVLPTEEDFEERISGIIKDYPYLVCEENGEILGYAYAHRQMEREAYQWNAELSIYLDKSFTSKGVGKKLYCILIDILKLQGIKTVYGGVTVPNKKSEGLHLGLGFTSLGVYHNTGYKNNKWHDVEWFEKQIMPYNIEPEPFVSITKIDSEKIQEIINKY
jgi:L-amino acid N-acyltransferase YncA